MADQQQLSTFKLTSPEVGEIRFLFNSSNDVEALTISINDCAGNSRIESVANLSKLTIGTTELNLINGEPYIGYYFYQVSPVVAKATIEGDGIVGVCTTTDLIPPPTIDTFKNSEYNVIFNNATKLRRINRTGSLEDNYGGIFEIDRKADQILPQNFNAILSGSAVSASFQESNIYSKAWTLPRYEGSKNIGTPSGSLTYDDPALTFTEFQGIKFALTDTNNSIRSQSSGEGIVENFYFNSPYIQNIQGRDLNAYFHGSTSNIPPAGQPVYELVGKEFKRITRSKVFIPGTKDILRIPLSTILYEVNPDNLPPLSIQNNIFNVYVRNDGEYNSEVRYFFFNTSNNPETGSLRGGEEDSIQVSGSFDGNIDGYSLFTPSVEGAGAQNRGGYLPIRSDDTKGLNFSFDYTSSYNNLT